MKHAAVYLRCERLFFQPEAQTTAGVWVGSAVIRALPITSSREEKGLCALEALGLSQIGIPHPSSSEWKRVLDGMLTLYELAGVKRWDAFARNALSCSLHQEVESIRITPYERIPSPYQFAPLPHAAIVLPADAAPSALGEALEQAMKRCR